MRRSAAAAAVSALAILALVTAAVFWIRGPSAALPRLAGDANPTSTASAAPAGGHRPGLPDARLTPGAVNPAVTAATLSTTICKPGWTKTVRPPSAYTNTLKLAQIVEYGYADKDPTHYEEDHLVPLELGGAPRDPRNLWPEPRGATLADGTGVGADAKDGLENALHDAVCSGSWELGDAQRAIAGDWVAVWMAAGSP